MRQKAGLVILLGFRGSEDLGNGLKATFELEKRFDLYDGTNGNTNTTHHRGGASTAGTKDWDGAANMGLAGDWGRVRFGRINELSTETIRKFDPFYQYGVGGMLQSSQRSARIDNTARYDSPKWSGFSFGASYSLGGNTKTGGTAHNVAWDNDGYALNLSYDNGPFMATANWSRVADSDNSDTWNVGLAYKFGAVRVMALYESTDDEGRLAGLASPARATNVDQDTALIGLEWDIGPGQLDASVQWMDYDAVGSASDGDIWKYALGYTYNLSKRTSAYAQVAYTDYDKKTVGNTYTGQNRDSMTSVQIGMTHKF